MHVLLRPLRAKIAMHMHCDPLQRRHGATSALSARTNTLGCLPRLDNPCLARQLGQLAKLYQSVVDCMSCTMGSNLPMHVHLPSEDAYADDDSVIFDIASEEFSTDEFRMFDFKVC